MRARVRMLVPALLLAATPAVAGQAADPGVRMDVRVDPAEVTVGQPFVLTLTLERPAGMEIRLPSPPAADWGSLSVLDTFPAEQAEAADGFYRHELRFRLAAFETGTVKIPALPFQVRQDGEWQELPSPAAQIEVLSVLPPEESGEEEPELADLRGQASLPGSLLTMLLLLASGLSLLALLAYFWLRRRRMPGEAPAAAPPTPLLPPDEEALRALQQLAEGPLLAQGKVKLYHVTLADIIKRYLQRRFEVPTLERTTFEVVQATRLAPVDSWVPAKIAGLLSSCDLVKFARQRPDVDRCRALLEEARALVEQTRARADAPPAAHGEG